MRRALRNAKVVGFLLFALVGSSACAGKDRLSGPSNPRTPAAAELVFVRQPVHTLAARPLDSITVQIRDADGKVVSTPGAAVTLAARSSAGKVVSLDGPLTQQSVAGIATFTGISVVSPAVSVTLVASAPGLASATSSPFQVDPAPVIIDSLLAQLISDSTMRAAGTYTFRLTSSAAVVADSGSVIVGAGQGGFLRRVVHVNRTGSSVTYQTVAAALDEVLQDDSIVIRMNGGSVSGSNLSGAVMARPPRFRAASAELSRECKLVDVTTVACSIADLPLWDGGGPPGTGLTLKSGTFSVSFTPSLWAHFGALLNVKDAHIAITTTGTFDGTVEAGFDATSKADGSIPLGVIDVSVVTYPLPVLVTFDVPVTLEWSVSVGGTIDLEAEWTSSVSATAGGDWTPVSGWVPIATANFSFTPQLPEAQVNAGLTAHLGIQATPGVTFDLVAGGDVYAQPYAEAAATVDLVQGLWSTSCNSGVKVGYDVDARFFSITLPLLSGTTDVLDQQWPVCTRSGPIVPRAVPSIAGLPTSASFSGAGGASIPAQTYTIINGGTGTLDGLATSVSYASGEPRSWLTTSLASSTAPATLTLSASTAGLGAGTYSATVAVSSTALNVDNSPQTIPVTLTVSPAASDNGALRFTAQPGDVAAPNDVFAAGFDLYPAVTVEAQDSQGNRLSSYNQPVSLRLQGASEGAKLAGAGPVTPQNGVAVFGDLSIDKVGSGYTLVASSGSLPEVTSQPFSVTLPGDLNLDGWADEFDLADLTRRNGDTNRPPADINKDGIVNAVDLGILLANFTSSLQPLTATNIGRSGATLNGTVRANQTVTAWFDWGTDPQLNSYASTPGVNVGPGAAQPVSARLSGLSPGTTYYYRLVAKRDSTVGGRSDQAVIQSFTTGQPGTVQIVGTYEAENFIDSSPAVAADGTIYFASAAAPNPLPGGEVIYRIRPGDTSPEVVFRTGNNALGITWEASPVIGSDGSIIFPSQDGNLYILNSDGTERCHANVGSFAGNVGPAALTPANDIVVGGVAYGATLREFDLQCAQQWTFQPPAYTGGFAGAPGVSSEGTIYVAHTGKDSLYAVNSNGTVKWRAFINEGGTLYPTRSSVSIGANGVVYANANDGVVAFDAATGSQLWMFSTGSSRVDAAPSISSTGLVVFGDEGGVLHALDANGNQTWQADLHSSIPGAPAIGSDGTIYIKTYDGNVWLLSEAGSTIGSVLTGPPATGGFGAGSSPTLVNGLLYVASGDTLFGVSVPSPGLAATPWPKSMHDVRNSGLAPNR
jgi:outer membrane protein assembly factor BamB